MIQDRYEKLLQSWCDGLLSYQIKDSKNKRFRGGLMCPSCQRIHGRSADAVYPLLYMAHKTGRKDYLQGAIDLFHWGENVLCDDGSAYNDAQKEWNGITVFAAMSLFHSLEYHGELLEPELRAQFEERLRRMVQWIHETITPQFVTNINYHATAAAMLALAGTAWGRQDYLDHAKILAQSCRRHITEDGLFYGEGKPMEYVTPRGCRPVDIGYNAEESIPALLTYARTVKDEELLTEVRELLRKQLNFMLPDGAWDNSFGTRNFKWTYWGSRTSDGCQTAYGIWKGEEPVFTEAALRNLKLYEECTRDGLLYGGPHYYEHQEEPCIHHTFCHAKALAEVLDEGVEETGSVKLPAETAAAVQYFPTIDTYKISSGGFLATVTGYDFEYMEGGHASGGTMTMLWHEKTGPLLAASITDYFMKEETNMQLSVKKAQHRPLTPGVELWDGKVRYAQYYDYNSAIEAKEEAEGVMVRTSSRLVNVRHESLSKPVFSRLDYHFGPDRLEIRGELQGDRASEAALILPIIGYTKNGCTKTDGGYILKGDKGQVLVKAEGEIRDIQPIFYLVGGFEAWRFEIGPDSQGRLSVTLEV